MMETTKAVKHHSYLEETAFSFQLVNYKNLKKLCFDPVIFKQNAKKE
jgi:hypothetical protein